MRLVLHTLALSAFTLVLANSGFAAGKLHDIVCRDSSVQTVAHEDFGGTGRVTIITQLIGEDKAA